MTLRDRPYGQFRFLVDLGGGAQSDEFKAGFQEVSGLGMEITVSEYRNGNHKDNAPMKITGTYKVPDVTLKRGVIGDSSLYEWLDQTRNGSQDALRTVRIDLMPESSADQTPAQSWILKSARITKYTGPALNGKGTDVAVEEIVLASERIDQEF
jgi:phage tail-like protein